MTDTGPTETMRTAFGEALAQAVADSPKPLDELAAAMGWSVDYLRKLMRGERTPNPWALFILERQLDVPPGAISRHLGIQPVDAPPSVPAAIEADPRLTDRDRRLLIRLYRETVRHDDSDHA